MDSTKLNLGCGDDIREGYVNVDIAERPGVDVVHDLRELPWPLPDGQFEEVRFIDILEHLPDTVATLEEIWRVCKPDAEVHIRVPAWNSKWAWMDPQHLRGFAQETFFFFDPDSHYCKKRPYYTKARFHVEHTVFECTFLRLGRGFTKTAKGLEQPRLIQLLNKFSNTVHFLQVKLRVVK